MDCFSIDEVLRLLAAARAARESDWLLICVTFLHALRASEAVGITGDNIVGDYLVVRRGKGSKGVREELRENENPLLNERKALIALAAKTPHNQRLFPISARTFQRRMHRYGAAAGLAELLSHPHTLKHSIITHLDGKGLSTREIQEISGHRSLRSLERYLHTNTAVVQAKYKAALKV